MKEFKDKVAVITGAASGIGYGLAERCAQEGMKIVLAGINADTLAHAEETLRDRGATTLAVQCDVSKADDVEALARKVIDSFGAVHVLVNNAGVGAGSSVWESTLADWEWVIGVNLWGVIHGLKVFVPIMLAQDTECHIVNVSSIAGLLSGHPSAPYTVTKHGVVAISEHTHLALAQRKAKIKVSVLCPGWVKTRILDSGRNRPPKLRNPEQTPTGREQVSWLEQARQALESGMSPQQIADHVFAAIRQERFWILTHPEWNPQIQQRMESILH